MAVSANDLFVFDTFAGPKPVRRQSNVVVLNDTTDLQVVGKMKTKVDFNVDGYAHFGHYLLIFMMEQIKYQVEWEEGECGKNYRDHVKLLSKRSRDTDQAVSTLVLGESGIECGE